MSVRDGGTSKVGFLPGFLLSLLVLIIVYLSFPVLIAGRSSAPLNPPTWLLGIVIGALAGLFIFSTPIDNALLVLLSVTAGFIVRLVLTSIGGSRGHAQMYGGQPTLLDLVVPLVCALIVCVLVSWVVRKGFRRAATGIAALTLLIAVIFSCAQVLAAANLNEPIENGVAKTVTISRVIHSTHLRKTMGSVAYDGYLYAQTINNMRQGQSYYRAFTSAAKEDARYTKNALASAFNFREPFIPMLLARLPGSTPYSCLIYYLCFTVISALAAGFLLARFTDKAFALCGFLLVFNYFIAVAMNPVFTFDWLFAEVWAAGFIIMAFWALATKRIWLSSLLLIAAVASREFALALVPVWVVAWVLSSKRDKKEWLPYVVGIIGSIAVIVIHLKLAPATGSANGFSLATWLRGSLTTYMYTMRYKVRYVVGFGYVMPLLPAFAFAGVMAIRENRFRIPFVLTVLGYTTFYLRFSAGRWSDYWGAFIIPLFLCLAVLITAFVFPSRSNRKKQSRKASKVTVVLPAYNEAKSIADLLSEIEEALTPKKLLWRVTVMDDASSDETANLARATLPPDRLTVISNEHNLGLGGNIERGLRLASQEIEPGEVIVTLDADLTQRPAYIPKLIEAYEQGADVVIASRYRPGSKVRGLSGFRRFMTFAARWLLSLLFPILNVRDYSCGFRLYDGTLLKSEFERFDDRLIQQKSFACMTEILCKMRHDIVVAEIPFVLEYGRKRQASAMDVGNTIRSYFSMFAEVARADFTVKD